MWALNANFIFLVNWLKFVWLVRGKNGCPLGLDVTVAFFFSLLLRQQIVVCIVSNRFVEFTALQWIFFFFTLPKVTLSL